jgi:hypothetical protein
MVRAIRDEMAAYGIPEETFSALPANEFSALMWLLDRDWQAFKRVTDTVAEQVDA